MPEGKKRHLKCSGLENPVTCTSVVREGGRAEGDPAFPAKRRGVQQAGGTGLCLGSGAAGLACGSPRNATRVVAKMKDAERHPAAVFPKC